MGAGGLRRLYLRTWFAGFWEGVTSDPGLRRPMSWRTVVRLARLGQPPLI